MHLTLHKFYQTSFIHPLLSERSLRYVLSGVVLVFASLTILVFVQRPDAESVRQEIAADNSPADSLVNLESILGYSEYFRDSVITSLKQLSIDEVECDQPITLWYRHTDHWKPYFGNEQVLDRYLVREVRRLIEAGEMDVAVRLLLTLGRINGTSGDWSLSAARGQWAASLAEETANENAKGWAHMQIGVSYTFVLDSAAAMSNLRKAVRIAKKTGDQALLVTSEINIGSLYWRGNYMDSAVYYNRIAFEEVSPRERPNLYAFSLTEYASSLVAAGDCDTAREILHRHLAEKGEGGGIPYIMTLRPLLECAIYEEEDRPLAENYLARICHTAESLGDQDQRASCILLRARLNDYFGNTEQALGDYKRYLNFDWATSGEEERRDVALAEAGQRSIEQAFRAELAREREQEAEITRQRQWGELLRTGIMISSLIITGLLYLLGRQQILKERQRKENAEAKLLALRAQMNPHFMFNAVNGIQNQILKNNRIEAYGYLGKFAELLRMITKNTESTSIELQEEIKFLRTYLELEKLRFRSGFDFDLKLEPGMETSARAIPGMMVQPFVENAIIHGLSQLPYPGLLTLVMSYVPGGVQCSVRDNGRGRQAGRERAGPKPGSHLSLTYRNTESRIASLHENGFSAAGLTVNDLVQGGEPTGTEVVITLPFLEKKSFIKLA